MDKPKTIDITGRLGDVDAAGRASRRQGSGRPTHYGMGRLGILAENDRPSLTSPDQPDTGEYPECDPSASEEPTADTTATRPSTIWFFTPRQLLIIGLTVGVLFVVLLIVGWRLAAGGESPVPAPQAVPAVPDSQSGVPEGVPQSRQEPERSVPTIPTSPPQPVRPEPALMPAVPESDSLSKRTVVPWADVPPVLQSLDRLAPSEPAKDATESPIPTDPEVKTPRSAETAPSETDKTDKSNIPPPGNPGKSQDAATSRRYRPAPAGFTLAGTAQFGDRRYADLNGKLVAPGDRVNGATVVEVGDFAIVMEMDGAYFQVSAGTGSARAEADPPNPKSSKKPQPDDKPAKPAEKNTPHDGATE